MRAPMASPNFTAMRAASLLKTGSTPGSAMSTAHACVFGSAPYLVDAPENALLLVKSCVWISSPMTGSHFILRILTAKAPRTPGERQHFPLELSGVLAVQDFTQSPSAGAC